MHNQEEQLIRLLINNSYPAWEIEAVHKRCCLYFGINTSMQACQEIIDFARQSRISLLESFRLQVEITEMAKGSTQD